MNEYVAAIERRFPLGRGVCDVGRDYGFRPAVAVELRTADGKWFRHGLKIPRGRGLSPEQTADLLWGWFEGQMSKRIRAASDGLTRAFRSPIINRPKCRATAQG